jgi:2-polyprenyl-6-methoxyphenol hydroxylase-like FAD-dependent oxidoreductase
LGRADIARIGDAAHRASPQLGQGANMALLDALDLSEALASDADNPRAAYAAMRRWHMRAYQAMSRAFTPQYQSDSRGLPLIRDRLLEPLSLIPPIPAFLSRLVSGDFLPPLSGHCLP